MEGNQCIGPCGHAADDDRRRHRVEMGTDNDVVDAELLPCFHGDCSGASTAVRADSWGRIKASFR